MVTNKKNKIGLGLLLAGFASIALLWTSCGKQEQQEDVIVNVPILFVSEDTGFYLNVPVASTAVTAAILDIQNCAAGSAHGDSNQNNFAYNGGNTIAFKTGNTGCNVRFEQLTFNGRIYKPEANGDSNTGYGPSSNHTESSGTPFTYATDSTGDYQVTLTKTVNISSPIAAGDALTWTVRSLILKDHDHIIGGDQVLAGITMGGVDAPHVSLLAGHGSVDIRLDSNDTDLPAEGGTAANIEIGMQCDVATGGGNDATRTCAGNNLVDIKVKVFKTNTAHGGGNPWDGTEGDFADLKSILTNDTNVDGMTAKSVTFAGTDTFVDEPGENGSASADCNKLTTNYARDGFCLQFDPTAFTYTTDYFVCAYLTHSNGDIGARCYKINFGLL